MRRLLPITLTIAVFHRDAGAQSDDWDIDFGDGDDIEAAIEEQDDLSFDGDIITESYVYPENADAGPARHSVDVRARAEAQRQGTTARATLLVRKDLANSVRDRFEADEAYLDVGKGTSRLRVGRSHASWGSSTFFNPADQITPTDHSDLLETEDRPAFMAWARTEVGRVELEVYILPVPEVSVIPMPTGVSEDGSLVGDSRWISGDLPMEMAGVPLEYTIASFDAPPASPDNAGGAGRLSLPVVGGDVSLGYATFIGRVPRLEAEMTPAPSGAAIELRPVLDREHIFTLEAARPVGRARFAMETATVVPEGPRQAYASAVISADYTSADFRGDHSAFFLLEATTTQPLEDGELQLDPMSRLRHPFVAAVAARAEYRMGTEWRTRLSAVQNLDTLGLGRLEGRGGGFHDFALNPEVEKQLMGTVTLTAGYLLLRGARRSLFGSYEHNSRFVLSLSAAL